MNSFLFALGVLCFLIILFWYVQNERSRNTDGSRGILAMRKDDGPDSPPDH